MNSIISTIQIPVVNRSKHALPQYQTSGSAGLDLCANLDQEVQLAPLERTLIPTGIFMELPQGFEAQIRPRSGLAFKVGLTVLNSPGTIDSDYRGEVKVLLINLSKENVIVKDGERIAQMVVAKHEQIEWQAVDELNETDRGQGGYGSTGKN